MGEISLRVAQLSDAEELLAIYAPYVEETAITFEYEVPSVEEFTNRMKSIQSFYPYLVAEKDGHIVGYAYASRFHPRRAYDWSAEMAIYLDRKERHGGVGKLMYETLEGLLIKMGVLNTYACITSPEVEDEYVTKDSICFHKAVGYSLVGEFQKCGYKFDRWYHMVWMEKWIGTHTVPVEPVRAFEEGMLKEI